MPRKGIRPLGAGIRWGRPWLQLLQLHLLEELWQPHTRWKAAPGQSCRLDWRATRRTSLCAGSRTCMNNFQLLQIVIESICKSYYRSFLNLFSVMMTCGLMPHITYSLELLDASLDFTANLEPMPASFACKAPKRTSAEFNASEETLAVQSIASSKTAWSLMTIPLYLS